MKPHKLAVATRTEAGSRRSSRLRQSGQIPAVVYSREGHQMISVDRKTFGVAFAATEGSSSLFELEEGGKTKLTVLQDIQRDPLYGRFLHLDFQEVRQNEVISGTVHISLHGTPDGVANHGGIVEQQTHEVQVSCLPKDLPEHLDVEIAHLGIDESIYIKDLPEVSGVTYTDDPEMVIAAVKRPGATKAAEVGEDETTETPEEEKEGGEESKSEEAQTEEGKE